MSASFACRWHSTLRATVAVPLVMGLVTSCSSSGPEIAYVSGRVTMDGKPLPNATVVFVPENGRPAGATTDDSGHYVLNYAQGRKGAIPGMNSIRIMTFRDADQDENGEPIPASPETVPARYNSDSILMFEVEPKKKNVADFELESNGRIAATES